MAMSLDYMEEAIGCLQIGEAPTGSIRNSNEKYTPMQGKRTAALQNRSAISQQLLHDGALVVQGVYHRNSTAQHECAAIVSPAVATPLPHEGVLVGQRVDDAWKQQLIVLHQIVWLEELCKLSHSPTRRKFHLLGGVDETCSEPRNNGVEILSD